MRRLSTALLCALAAGTAAAGAADLEAGRKKSELCGACHGAVGISPNPAWPNLAGQQKDYLVKQLKDFREGRRADPWMSPMAKGLSDEDIANLAEFYHSLPIHDKYE